MSLKVIDGGKGGSGAPPDNPRHLTLMQVARLLDRDANTVRKWLTRDGCPYVTKAARDRGEAWVLDLADVVRWLERRASEEVAARMPAAPAPGAPAGEGGLDISKEEADRRRAWALALRAELELAEERSEVVRVSDALAAIAAEYADVRQALDSIPSKRAVDLAAMTEPEEIMQVLGEEIRAALETLKGDVRAAPEAGDDDAAD